MLLDVGPEHFPVPQYPTSRGNKRMLVNFSTQADAFLSWSFSICGTVSLLGANAYYVPCTFCIFFVRLSFWIACARILLWVFVLYTDCRARSPPMYVIYIYIYQYIDAHCIEVYIQHLFDFATWFKMLKSSPSFRNVKVKSMSCSFYLFIFYNSPLLSSISLLLGRF